MGYGLNERRVLPKAEKSIIRHAQNGLFSGLKAADYLKYDGAWPPPAERVLPFMHGLIGPRGWSCTELSRLVELPLRQDGQKRHVDPISTSIIQCAAAPDNLLGGACHPVTQTG